jgi:aminoglycoside phosphotransferase (APT) family kinase protein
MVARISEGGTSLGSTRRAVLVARWLAGNKFPTVVPAEVQQPIVVNDHIVTFWNYHPQPPGFRPSTGELGQLLRRLHGLPLPPVELPVYQPLREFAVAVEQCGVLSQGERCWLTAEARRLLDVYAELDSPLGRGHIHGDAYPGNVLHANGHGVLADWDETAFGPREIDLANTYQGTRFGRTEAELDAFAKAYGADLRHWPGLRALCAIRDLHTLSSYLRRAEAGDQLAGSELHRRVRMLRVGDHTTTWAAS